MAGHASLSSPSSSSSSSSYGWEYDVFLSYRGIDTGKGITCNLYNALLAKGIRMFFADKKLRGGEELAPTLDKNIRESRIAIPVFSENCASSSFCLDELATIMECIKAKGRSVLPVFYGVEPRDVRHQLGRYAKAMAKHEEKFKDHVVLRWRKSLKQAADLCGKHFIFGNDDYEHEFIQNIVKAVSNNINRARLHVPDY